MEATELQVRLALDVNSASGLLQHTLYPRVQKSDGVCEFFSGATELQVQLVGGCEFRWQVVAKSLANGCGCKVQLGGGLQPWQK